MVHRGCIGKLSCTQSIAEKMERFFSFHCRGRDGRIPDGKVGLESFPGDQEMSRGYRIKKSGDDRVSKAFFRRP